MKKRILSLLLALFLLAAALPVSAAAEDARLYGTVPIYTGYVDLDYMAQQILKDIDTAGKTDREKVLAVYNWIILNCRRYGTEDKEYFDMDEVMETSAGAFYDQLEEDFMDGNITFRIDVAGEMGSSDGFLPCDSNEYVAWAAYQMMLYRIGECHNFAGLLTVLLGHLGYDCRLIDGDFINNDGSTYMHKWNMVLLDGKYYWLDVRMDHANYERTGKLNHTYFLIEDTEQWAKKHSWDRSYSDAMMECAQLMVETYGLMLEIPGMVEDAFNELMPWSSCAAWAEEYLTAAVEREIYPDILLQADMTQAITREEFAAVAVRYYEALTGETAQLDKRKANPFTDVSAMQEDILIAYQLGVVNGMTETTFAPGGTLTREQAVTMLGRVVELAETGAIAKGEAGGLALKNGAKQVTFTDAGAISGWAKNYVAYFVSHGVIDGMGDGTFAPAGNMTREQAMKVAVVALGEQTERPRLKGCSE